MFRKRHGANMRKRQGDSGNAIKRQGGDIGKRQVKTRLRGNVKKRALTVLKKSLLKKVCKKKNCF